MVYLSAERRADDLIAILTPPTDWTYYRGSVPRDGFMESKWPINLLFSSGVQNPSCPSALSWWCSDFKPGLSCSGRRTCPNGLETCDNGCGSGGVEDRYTDIHTMLWTPPQRVLGLRDARVSPAWQVARPSSGSHPEMAIFEAISSYIYIYVGLLLCMVQGWSPACD